MTSKQYADLVNLIEQPYVLHICEHGDGMTEECQICLFEFGTAQVATTAVEGRA